jgi:hypothetical protein
MTTPDRLLVIDSRIHGDITLTLCQPKAGRYEVRMCVGGVERVEARSGATSLHLARHQFEAAHRRFMLAQGHAAVVWGAVVGAEG